MKFDRKDKIEIFENAISWIVVFAMFIYGGGKYSNLMELLKLTKLFQK